MPQLKKKKKVNCGGNATVGEWNLRYAWVSWDVRLFNSRTRIQTKLGFRQQSKISTRCLTGLYNGSRGGVIKIIIKEMQVHLSFRQCFTSHPAANCPLRIKNDVDSNGDLKQDITEATSSAHSLNGEQSRAKKKSLCKKTTLYSRTLLLERKGFGQFTYSGFIPSDFFALHRLSTATNLSTCVRNPSPFTLGSCKPKEAYCLFKSYTSSKSTSRSCFT